MVRIVWMKWHAGEKTKIMYKINKTGHIIINYLDGDKKVEKPKDMGLKHVYVGPDCYTDVFKEINENDIGKYVGFYETTPVNIPKDIVFEIIVD